MKRRVGITLGALIAFPLATAAQQPSAEQIVDVSEPVQQAIDAQVRTYKEGGRPEVLRLSDVLIYPFGIYQPVLTCTVLRACIVELEAGEVLISIISGDDQRWHIEPTNTGPGGTTPIISVKPTGHDITTNLVLSTDRRLYHITLDSPPKPRRGDDEFNPLEEYTRHVRFYYPDEHVRAMADAEEKMRRHEALRPGISVAPGALNYGYHWRADKAFPWEPTVVFDDAERMFIGLPESALRGELPVLLVGERGEEQLLNYVHQAEFIVVDGLFDSLRLVITRSVRPTIWRPRRQKQIALHIFPE